MLLVTDGLAAQVASIYRRCVCVCESLDPFYKTLVTVHDFCLHHSHLMDTLKLLTTPFPSHTRTIPSTLAFPYVHKHLALFMPSAFNITILHVFYWVFCPHGQNKKTKNLKFYLHSQLNLIVVLHAIKMKINKRG